METVVLFLHNRQGQNKIFTRTLRKVAFIDNRHPKGKLYPKHNEYWVVSIVRENENDTGGSFILKPLYRIEKQQVQPLVHGMYDIQLDNDAIILTPKEAGKFWAMSPNAKTTLLQEHPNSRSVVINHGGSIWQRRPAPNQVLQREMKRITSP
jgi:hypothetical protein